MKAYNFNAGPCVLPKEAIESTINAIRDFDNTGIGLMEISHRTPGWERTMEETRQLWRDILNIPAEYVGCLNRHRGVNIHLKIRV